VILLGLVVLIGGSVERLAGLSVDCSFSGGSTAFFFSVELSVENKKGTSFLDSSKWVKISGS
jgi:allantoicase